MEFCSWAAQWQSFFNASHLDLLDLENQQQSFRVCLDPNLYDISSSIDGRTPIFGPGG